MGIVIYFNIARLILSQVIEAAAAAHHLAP
jgi:hypothetical protein